MPRKLTPKEEALMILAEKGGNDASLFLLDKIEETENRVAEVYDSFRQIKEDFLEIKNAIQKELPEDIRIEKIASRLSSKLAIKAEEVTPTEQQLLDLITPLIPKVENGHTPTKEELLVIIKPLIPKTKDGHTPTKEEILALIEPLIPKVESPDSGKIISAIEKNLETNLPKFGTAFRDGLELLEGDERLEQKAIKGLLEELEGLRKKKVVFGGGGGMTSSAHSPIHERFTMNGTNTSVTLAQAVSAQGTAIILRYNGQTQDITTHYTVDGNEVSLTFTPEPDSIISITYWP